MVNSHGVAGLYPCYKGFVFGLVVGCFEHEFEGVLIPCSSGTFYDETSSSTILS